jgi:predicted 3-demethylubiquinone-9 3-methyltransferase (glyoxalase superfamily)
VSPKRKQASERVSQTQEVTPCLWFNGQAEQAAAYYVSLLPGSRIDRVVRSPAAA